MQMQQMSTCKHLYVIIFCYLLCVRTDHRSVFLCRLVLIQLRSEWLPLSHSLTEMLLLLFLWDPCLHNIHKSYGFNLNLILNLALKQILNCQTILSWWDKNDIKMSSFWNCNTPSWGTKVKNSFSTQPKSVTWLRTFLIGHFTALYFQHYVFVPRVYNFSSRAQGRC